MPPSPLALNTERVSEEAYAKPSFNPLTRQDRYIHKELLFIHGLLYINLISVYLFILNSLIPPSRGISNIMG